MTTKAKADLRKQLTRVESRISNTANPRLYEAGTRELRSVELQTSRRFRFGK